MNDTKSVSELLDDIVYFSEEPRTDEERELLQLSPASVCALAAKLKARLPDFFVDVINDVRGFAQDLSVADGVPALVVYAGEPDQCFVSTSNDLTKQLLVCETRELRKKIDRLNRRKGWHRTGSIVQLPMDEYSGQVTGDAGDDLEIVVSVPKDQLAGHNQ